MFPLFIVQACIQVPLTLLSIQMSMNVMGKTFHVVTMLNARTQKVVLSVTASQDTQEMDMQAVQVCNMKCLSY